jgi:transposase-like protein
MDVGRQPYAESFKARMVEKMSGPGAVSATALSGQVGVAQATLSRWLLDARSVAVMANDRDEKSPRQWTSEEKLRALIEASKLDDAQLGEFLRREGIHKAQLDEWRAAAEAGLAPAAPRGGPQGRRIKELERDLAKKEKALAEVTALLVLKKKLQALYGDEESDTNDGSEK